MSELAYFAADKKLDEALNPYIEFISVNQALKRGLKVDLDMYDKDEMYKPGMIMVCESEEKYYYPNISKFKKEEYNGEMGTSKKFCTRLEWLCTDEHIEVLLQYIKKQMIRNDELEIWRIWMGSRKVAKKVKITECRLEELTAVVLKSFYTKDKYPIMLKITK